MRRTLLLPVAAAIAAASLAACGSSSSTTSSTAGGSSTSSATPGASPSSTTIQTGNPTSAVTLNEAGSSLLLPYLGELVAPLRSAFPNVTLAPAAGGSGLGIENATNGVSDLGGTDAYLSSSEMQASPGLLNIPIVVSSQAVNYNLPGVTNLKLSGSVLAQMYQGRITTWNAPAIAKLNPGVTLPSTKVVPIHRSDSSGDTFLFTSFLSATSPSWSSGPGENTTVTWPNVSGEETASGNPGMVQTCSSTPGCVAYIGISAESTAKTAKLGEAMLQNKAGDFVQSSPTTVNAAVAASSGAVMPSLAADLIDAGGAQSYPIVNFEYLAVKDKQSSASKAMAIRDFFSVALSPSEGATPTNLAKESFEALPSSVLPRVVAAVNKIGS